ncbi:MAG: hypothetical protein M1814_006399 [Vezdaea aestivalis]|nr:MAG: hypothetical protein M1814_006399 [Vezdaea aestivalis]
MSLPDESTGNLIALEGDVAAIATQLRLLPPSSKILTLPAFASALPKSLATDNFDPANYVRQVHETFKKRHDYARSFLKASTGSQPRLVFLNGGCVSARTACITKIAEELANSDTREGERLFEEVVKGGVAGLYPQPFRRSASRKRPTSSSSENSLDRNLLGASQTPGKKAGPPSMISEKFFDAKSEHHDFGKASAKDVQTGDPLEPQRDSIIDTKTVDSRPSFEKRTSFGSYTSQQHGKVEDDPDFEEAAEHHEDNDDVVYGEACVVSVARRSTASSVIGSKELRRAHSVDVLSQDNSQRPITPPSSVRRVRSLELVRSKFELPTKRGSSLDNLPRTVYVRRPSNPKAPKHYVDRGTDAQPEQRVFKAPFQPVFPLVEDLVIHFSDGHAYEIFDTVLSSYRNGQYNQLQASQALTPLTGTTRPTSIATVETDDEGQARRHENSFQANNIDRHKFLSSKSIPGVLAPGPLTPAEAPPLMRYPSTRFERFIEFTALTAKSALGIQNAFRAVLAQRFPPALGYKQLPFASDTDRFWKPVLRIDEGFANDGRTVDLILAVGHAERVNRDVFHNVCGKLAQLGSRRSGLTKSSTIDIRYLIASALSALPADSHPTLTASPLTHPTLMAELLVPHIEAYLAGNELTRLFLLKHEAAHLPLILELRRLMGEDIFKIASVLDPASTSVSDPRGASPNLLSNEGTSMLNARSRFTAGTSNRAGPPAPLSLASRSPNPKGPDELLNKANFLISASATETDTRDFIESVRKVLVVKNHSFEPETPILAPPQSHAHHSSRSRHNRNMSSTSTAAAVAAAAVQAANALPPPPVPKSPTTAARARPRSRSRSRVATPKNDKDLAGDAASVVGVDPWDGFQDSEDDEMDRMFMPTIRRGGRKPNSKKALKWLGLA